ncbi:MAG: dTDP-4-dehydrorhamnose 3,5-epimerase [Muribaculaceae bacterium]|nr:dTDP-4-dehydrorhamnose 3,5-epimerase [Muribaculaceae bacterium]MDE6165874.1 dTDP-4-dehydrorhamnose 3,5-epimerase [Muribaculaceae bacterium]
MEVIKTEIEGPLIFSPKVFGDSRGYFFESYSRRELEAAVGHPIDWVQENESMSVRGVMRGLHFQRPPFAQAKLVRCVRGAVVDVAVDLRAGSPTYGRHIAVELTESNRRAVYIPRGFAHGFAVVSDEAVFQYKCDNYYAPESEGGISLSDDSLGIAWPFSPAEAILSEKDMHHPLLREFITPFSL